MLGKLIKYEIKATARTFLPLYLALLLFAVINLLMPLNKDSFSLSQGLALTLYILILIGMFVTSFIVMIQRFYKNLLSEEGYLMFTLPVKPWKHIVSKLIVSSMWILLSSLVAVMSIIIIALQEVTITDMFRGIGEFWTLAYDLLGSSLYHFVIQFVAIIIVSVVTSILLIYVSIAIGQLSNNHKTMLSIGSFLGIYILSQLLASVILVLPLFKKMGISIYTNTQLTQAPPTGLLWGAIALSAILATIYFFVTNLILNKKPESVTENLSTLKT